MLKNTTLVDTLLGFMGIITLCSFIHKNTLLMIAMQMISKTCECLSKYWNRILPWTIQKQNVFILEGHRNGNQRQIIISKATKQSRLNVFGNTNKTRYLQRKSGTQRTYKEGQHTYAYNVTTSTIKINKRAILLALLILSAHGINNKQRNVHMLAQDLPSSQKQGVSHKQHNDAYQNISGNEGDSLTMTPNWVKPEGHQTDYTRRIPA